MEAEHRVQPRVPQQHFGQEPVLAAGIQPEQRPDLLRRDRGVAVEAQESTDGTVLLTLRVDASPNMSANGAHKLAVELVEAADTMEDLADKLARAGIAVLVAP